jgi:low temperature requirement protein LtrA
MQLIRSLFALYAFRGTDAASFMTFVRITIWLAVSSTFWIAGGLVEPQMRVIFWIAALAIEYAGPAMRYWVPSIGASPPETLDIHGDHLAERCALFVIIALGETILTTGKNASSHMDNAGTPLVLCCAFLSTIAMWWIYFHDGQEKAADKAEETTEPQATAQHLFTYGHLPIVAGIILTAVGEDFSLSDPEEKGSYAHALALLGGPILFLAGTAWMKTVSSRFMPYSHAAGIVLTAGCFLLVPFVANFEMQIFATAILLFVATWEYVALKRRMPRAA